MIDERDKVIIFHLNLEDNCSFILAFVKAEISCVPNNSFNLVTMSHQLASPIECGHGPALSRTVLFSLNRTPGPL
jgi:hypothetical protein